jgi:hypothetical protein
MASISQAYQLRNEFYSSFLVSAAVLLSIGELSVFVRRRERGLHSCTAGCFCRLLIAALGSFALVVLGLLAKVQALPLLALYLIAVSLVLVYGLGWEYVKAFALGLVVVSSAVGLGAIAYLHGLDISLPQAVLVLLLISGPSALLASLILLSPTRALGRGVLRLVFVALGHVVMTSVLLGSIGNVEWLRLLANPLSVHSYAVAASECAGGKGVCLFVNGLRGLRYLFERSVDSYVLAPFVCLAVVIGCGLVLAGCLRLWRHSRPGLSSRWLASFSGSSCLIVSFVMAFLAGQRWAVDHYLPYQQPFLFAGLILLSGRAIALFRAWRLVLVVVAVSVVLLFLRYPSSSRATYVKENPLADPATAALASPLCAAQHAGSEWKHSSLWSLCDGFQE